MRDRIDRFVFPAANQLNPDWDLQALADLVEGLDKECIVMGLGAQAHHEGQDITLRPGTINFLKALSDHARTIFVRGPYTAEICAKYGVTNVEPLGCPSITLNPDPTLGRLIQSRFN